MTLLLALRRAAEARATELGDMVDIAANPDERERLRLWWSSACAVASAYADAVDELPPDLPTRTEPLETVTIGDPKIFQITKRVSP